MDYGENLPAMANMEIEQFVILSPVTALALAENGVYRR